MRTKNLLFFFFKLNLCSKRSNASRRNFWEVFDHGTHCKLHKLNRHMVLGEGSKSKCILDIALYYCGSFPSRAGCRNFLGQRFFLGQTHTGHLNANRPASHGPALFYYKSTLLYVTRKEDSKKNWEICTKRVSVAN